MHEYFRTLCQNQSAEGIRVAAGATVSPIRHTTALQVRDRGLQRRRSTDRITCRLPSGMKAIIDLLIPGSRTDAPPPLCGSANDDDHIQRQSSAY